MREKHPLRHDTDRPNAMRVRIFVVIVLLLLLTGCTRKQETAAERERMQAQRHSLPAGWQVRVEETDASVDNVKLMNMPPGWHITTGPAALLYRPENTAAGLYRLESESFLFADDRLEGHGVFFGGQGLDAPDSSYTSFLLRKDGRFQIEVRQAGETSTPVAWTEHVAVAKPAGEQPAKNVLAVAVTAEKIRFHVNGQQVAELPRTVLPSEGIFGLRVRNQVNVHVTSLTVTPAVAAPASSQNGF